MSRAISALWGELARAHSLTLGAGPEASAATVAGRFKGLTGIEPWKIEVSEGGIAGHCSVLTTQDGGNLYFTSGNFPQTPHYDIRSVTPADIITEGQGFEEARLDMMKALLSGVCAVEEEAPGVLDHLRGAKMILYAQTDTSDLAFRLAQEAVGPMRDLFGAGFEFSPKDVVSKKVTGLPMRASVMSAFAFYDKAGIATQGPIEIYPRQRQEFGRRLLATRFSNGLVMVSGLEPKEREIQTFGNTDIARAQAMAESAYQNFLALVKRLRIEVGGVVRVNGALRSAPGFGGQHVILGSVMDLVQSRNGSLRAAQIARGLSDKEREAGVSFALNILFQKQAAPAA